MAGTARENAKVEPLPAQLKMGGERPGEKVFYNSAKARRTCCGRLHYCVACPVCWLGGTDCGSQDAVSLRACMRACMPPPSSVSFLCAGRSLQPGRPLPRTRLRAGTRSQTSASRTHGGRKHPAWAWSASTAGSSTRLTQTSSSISRRTRRYCKSAAGRAT